MSSENTPRYKTITAHFTTIAPDLQGLNTWRYQRQISPGIQEFIEAISFQHYLEKQSLITFQEAQNLIPGGVELTEDDYLLGLFDLVGELMRFAVTSMATEGSLPRAATKSDDTAMEIEVGGEAGEAGGDILTDLRSLRMHFEALDTTSSGAPGGSTPLKRDVEKKMEVMKTCVEKVEKGVYGMIVRGRERPKGWMPDMTEERGGTREAVESY